MLNTYLSFETTVFANYMFRIQLFAFRFLGYFVKNNDPLGYINLLRGALNAALFLFTMIIQIMFLTMDSGNIETFTMVISSFIVYINIFLKVVYFYAYRKDYFDLVNYICNKVDNVMKGEDSSLTKYYYKHAKKTNLQNSIIGVALMLSLLSNIYGGVEFVATYYVDLNQDTFGLNATLPTIYVMLPMRIVFNNFIVVYILPLYIEIFGSLAFFTWTTFYVSLLRSAAFQLDVVNFKLQRLTTLFKITRNDGNNAEQRVPDYCKALLIKFHKDLINIKWFIQKYEKITKTVIFVESLTATTLMCFLTYQMSQLTDYSTGGVIGAGIFLFVGILFMYYWNANEVSSKSDNVSTCIYLSNWYELPNQIQKDVLLFMRGSVKPVRISAIFFSMEMSTFVLILKTSYSYFTLLTYVASKEEN